MKLLAVVGLKREARIASGRDVQPVIGGGDALALQARLEQAVRQQHPAGIVSIGLAGGLDPSLKAGSVVVARAVLSAAQQCWRADPDWSRTLAERLPGAVLADIAGVSGMLIDAEAKATLRSATRAAAADMESHIAAEAADRHGLPFAAVRAISDGAKQNLPKAVLAGMRPDGGMDLAGVLGELARRPWELAALIRTGLEAETAFRALLGCRQRLGGTLGLADIQRL